ncbi:c-type cytochrome [Polaribacter sp. L3A8]|uniref:c-type cytochrome n=1 Tax=Polaribacter sp. L3A8 TaxID=2686361 RepID=UPI00131D1255|nr:c-type cytochrome [Polaribacter sp. L3A8]
MMYFLLLIVSSLVLGCKDSTEKINLEKIQKGRELFTSVGCTTCHSLSKDKLYGPSLNFILGTKKQVIRNGKEYAIIIDSNYIKKSIIDPDYEKSLLFKSNKMPKPSLTSIEVDCITNYLINMNNKSQEK